MRFQKVHLNIYYVILIKRNVVNLINAQLLPISPHTAQGQNPWYDVMDHILAQTLTYGKRNKDLFPVEFVSLINSLWFYFNVETDYYLLFQKHTA